MVNAPGASPGSPQVPPVQSTGSAANTNPPVAPAGGPPTNPNAASQPAATPPPVAAPPVAPPPGRENVTKFLDIQDDGTVEAGNLDSLIAEVRRDLNQILTGSGISIQYTLGMGILPTGGGKYQIERSVSLAQLQEIVRLMESKGTAQVRQDIYNLLHTGVTRFEQAQAAIPVATAIPPVVTTPPVTTPSSTPAAAPTVAQPLTNWQKVKSVGKAIGLGIWKAPGAINHFMDNWIYGPPRKVTGAAPDTFNFFRSNFFLWKFFHVFQGGGAHGGAPAEAKAH